MAGSGREARDALRERWRAAGWYPDLTSGQAIEAGARHHPLARVIFAPVGGSPIPLTLREIGAGARLEAARLASIGVGAGDAVIVQAPADAPSTKVLVALWLLEAVVVPLTVSATPAEVGHAARETGAAIAVVVAKWRGLDLAAGLAAHAPELGLRSVVVLGEGAPPGTTPLSSLDASRPLPPSDHDPSALACVLYTSGSTSAPKGVRHSHETLLCGVTAVPADADSRMLVTFPAGHVASLLGLLRPLTVGGTTVVMDRWSAGAAAALIEAQRLTTSAGTPFFLSTLLDEAERSGHDISSLSRFLVGAAAVPPALVARAEATGIVTWRTYGSTEHPAISAGSPLDPPRKRRLTDGKVAPGNEVRLVDETDSDVAPGEEGEIIARGPKQFLGYQDPSLETDAFVDQTWFRTGDLGRLDSDGHLVVTDRVKEIIIRGGENVSAREVEDVLASHPHIREVAVTAMPDAVWGEAVSAFVIARPDTPVPTLTDLQDHARQRGLAAHKLPTKLIVLDDLPRTAAGKVRKRDLRRLPLESLRPPTV